MTKLKEVFSLLYKATAKRKYLALSLGSILVLVLALGICLSRNLIYEVYVDGISVGYVRSYSEYEEAISSIEQTDGSDATEVIEAKPTISFEEIKEDLSHLNQVSSTSIIYANNKAASDDSDLSYDVGQAIARELSSGSTLDEQVLNSRGAKDFEIDSNNKAIEESLDEGTAPVQDNVNTPSDVQQTLAQEDSLTEQTEAKLYISSKKLESLVRNMLDLKQEAVSIVVNGQAIASVESQAKASEVEKLIKEHYTPNNKDYTILSVTMSDEINTENIYENSENILTSQEAAEKIIKGAESTEIYIIKQGDTIWDIAINNSISTDDIQSANPDLNLDSIQIDDEIVLNYSTPYVTVQVKAQSTTEETVPYDTKEVSDNTLAKGTTKVTEEGQNGLQEIVADVTLVNGVITSQEILSTKVIKSAVTKQIAVGTKVTATSKPSSSSSSYSSSSSSGTSSSGFIRPTVGVLTSDYGWRSRGFHTGIDLASATGTKIVASKAGTVTFSGWQNGYGNVVIISHGNGVTTLYAHNSSNKVSVGESVSQGQTIALMGSTGNSTGPHCHFEVRINGVHQNPWNYIN